MEERETHAIAGLGGAAGFGQRPALMVIDVQYRSVGDRPMPIREAIKQYATSCGEAGWHAIAHIAELARMFRENSGQRSAERQPNCYALFQPVGYRGAFIPRAYCSFSMLGGRITRLDLNCSTGIDG